MSNKQAIEIINEKKNDLKYAYEWEKNIRDEIKYILDEILNEIQSLPDTDEWISADNPPDDSHWYVLCYVKYLNSLWTSHYMDVLSYNNWKWSKDFEENNVTHWKPLPEVPKK